MSMPNYIDYNINQLRDCERHIDGQKFPERLKAIQNEIALRTRAGEIESDPSFEEFIASGIPFWVGVKAWWFFTWRSILFLFLLMLAFKLPIALISQIVHLPGNFILVLKVAYGILIIPVIGIAVMMQTFSRHYWGHRIYIRKIDEDPI